MYLCGGIVGNVNDCVGVEGEELVEEVFVVVFVWWIDDDDGFVWWKCEFGEDCGGVVCLECGVGDVVGGGVFVGEVDGCCVEFDVGNLFEGGCGGECEEFVVVVGIDEEVGVGCGCLLVDVVGEGG